MSAFYWNKKQDKIHISDKISQIIKKGLVQLWKQLGLVVALLAAYNGGIGWSQLYV